MILQNVIHILISHPIRFYCCPGRPLNAKEREEEKRNKERLKIR